MFAQNQPVQCKDGFHMSVQASGFHCCTPRIDNANEYLECEIGFPSQAEPLLMEWIEVPGGNPTQNIYVYVPSHVVALVIAKHGGMVSGEVPVGVERHLTWANSTLWRWAELWVLWIRPLIKRLKVGLFNLQGGAS